MSLSVGSASGEVGKKIPYEDFLSWLKVTLDINGPNPSDIIHTDHGDLILDKTYAGKIYLKGLLVSDGSSAVKPYIFGYNLLQGCVNRDRRSMTTSSKEAEVLVGIWDQAIQHHGNDVLDKYIDLLQDHHSCADVTLAEIKIPKPLAEIIWQRLYTVATAQNRFYYCENYGDKTCDFIRKSLKKQPSPLSVPLWNLLRRFSLIRTPQEQRDLFRNSELAEVKWTTFAINVDRAFCASLLLDPGLPLIKTLYVRGGDTGPAWFSILILPIILINIVTN